MYLDDTYTKRLFIRKVIHSDINLWIPFFNDKKNAKYTGIDLTMDDKTLSTIWIEKQLHRYENDQFGLYSLIHKDTNKFIGLCGLLLQKINCKDEIEIGYHILPEYRGNGFATEAALFFRDYAFENNITNSLVSVIHEDNVSSKNVANKIGMKKYEKVIDHEMNFYIDGYFYIYRVNKHDFNL